MFYYPIVLHRHTGCFSTIWLAATKGIRITRRDYLKVNVRRTCEDIIDYVTVQVPASEPNMAKPRFSLYLSSQLQYGVVIVYHRQCGLLLEETQQTIERLLRTNRYRLIDVAEPERLALEVPDNMCLMVEAEGAQDPFFGVMKPDQLPSPYKIHQITMQEEASQHSLVPSSHTTPNKNSFISPPAAITLKEKELLVASPAERIVAPYCINFQTLRHMDVLINEAHYRMLQSQNLKTKCFEGTDLPEATANDIDFLMNQQDYLNWDEGEREVERQLDREHTRELEGAMTSVDQLRESALGTDRETIWLLDDTTGQPVEVPLATISMEMTPPPAVAMPAPPSGTGSESERAPESSTGERERPGRRRRQLVFADPRVQISEEVMKKQIKDPLTETLPLSAVLLDFTSITKASDAAQLLIAPSSSLLHPDLLSLWTQCAHLTALPRSGTKRTGVEGEETMERGMEKKERKRRNSSMREIPRDMANSGLNPTEASSVSDAVLDLSKEDRSHSDLITPDGKWSPQEVVQAPLMPIVEEHVSLPETEPAAAAGRQGISAHRLFRLVSSYLQGLGDVTFDALLPPKADRTTAAHNLYTLLELVSSRVLWVQQNEPYDVITITPGLLSYTS